jgi:hypothetical protein
MYSVAVGPVTGGPTRRAEAKADLFSSRDVGRSCHCRERGGGARGQELRKENGLNRYLVKPAGRATLARVGPMTPKRATTSLAASVDPTEARQEENGAEATSALPTPRELGGAQALQASAVAWCGADAGAEHLDPAIGIALTPRDLPHACNGWYLCLGRTLPRHVYHRYLRTQSPVDSRHSAKSPQRKKDITESDQ